MAALAGWRAVAAGQREGRDEQYGRAYETVRQMVLRRLAKARA